MRVVVGEDDALYREGLVRLLTEAGYEVVGQARDAPELERKVAGHRPELVVTDVRMPPDGTDDGLRAAIAIRRRFPDIAVLVLSQRSRAWRTVERRSTPRSSAACSVATAPVRSTS